MFDRLYSPEERVGVVFLGVAGILTLSAILVLAASRSLLLNGAFTKEGDKKSQTYTNLIGYYVSLLVACTFQGIGSTMNLNWVQMGGVEVGGFCRAQGGLKQAGNVGVAVWSFVITLHLFNSLFLRWASSARTLGVTLVVGWAFVLIVVVIGPLALQNPSSGDYFGPAGLWCWIRDPYKIQRTMLEYFIEYLSAGFCLVLYVAILLRVRGNLQHSDEEGWTLRFVPRHESWQLSFSRDLIDSYMMRLAHRMIWFPVAYSLMLLPISIARLSESTGHRVPLWATILGGVVFNLTGFVNVLLYVITRRLFPDASSMPDFSMQRSKSPVKGHGITPFMLFEQNTLQRQGSFASTVSASSLTPLRRPEPAAGSQI